MYESPLSGSSLGSFAAPLLTSALFQPLAALLFHVALLAGAGDSPPIDSHKPQATIEGVVLSVGESTLSLKETATNSPMAFAVAPYVTVRKDGQMSQLAAVRPGDVAQVTTDTDGREYMAIAINATTPNKK